MTLNVVHTDNAPVERVEFARILVMGPAARAIAGALLRLESRTEICSADTPAEAVEFLKSGDFDHVLIDNRADGSMALTIPRLAALHNVGRLTVLAGPKSRDAIAAVPGVAQVISTPYNPVEIATSLGIEIRDNRNRSNDENNLGRRESDEASQEIHGEVDKEAGADTAETEDMRPVFVRFVSALVHFIPGLTPVLSMIYKNTALTALAALFVAFITYGMMIVFFLTASGWSTPLQLQVGHELVIKAERERGELTVKRNLINQQIRDLEAKRQRGLIALERANILSQIVGSTIDQELANHADGSYSVEDEVAALKEVLAAYGSERDRRNERARIQSAFKQRIITRDYYQKSLLDLSRVEENIVNLKSRIALKESELKLGSQSEAYLKRLRNQLDGVKSDTVIANGKAEFVPLANQVIEVKQIRSGATADLAEYEGGISTLRESQSVLNASIAKLEQTPMIRALEKPITVLFVPYDNQAAYQKGESLYACGFAVFWCGHVGAVGDPIGGEITTTHPFFGKPIRGQFVEANLTDPSAAQEEIIHVGRPLLFF